MRATIMYKAPGPQPTNPMMAPTPPRTKARGCPEIRPISIRENIKKTAISGDKSIIALFL